MDRQSSAPAPDSEPPRAAPPHFGRGDLQAIFEAAPGIQLVLAPDAPRFTMLAASDERLVATLTSRDDVIGRPLFDVFSDANPDNPEPSGVANLRASLDTVLRTRATHVMPVQRYDLQRPDGSWEVRYWAPRNVPVLGPDGEVRYIVHHVRDVTELLLEREATAAAERSAAELRAVLESMRDGLLIGTPEGITLANRAGLDQLGYARTTDLPRRFAALAAEVAMRDAASGAVLTPEHLGFARALTGERVVQGIRVRRRGSGEERVLRSVATPVIVDGAVIAAVVVNTDVTEQVLARHEIEALLDASERAREDAEIARIRLEAVLASIADAFYLLDRDWRFTYVNAAAEPLLQTTRDQLLGRTLWDAFPGVIGSPFEGPYREAMATGRVTSAEAYFPPLGAWFDVRTYPWSGGLMVHFRDISARKAAEAERERLLAEAEEANRAKSEFLAVMSHELRTPLNAIGGYVELLELGIHGPVSAAQRSALERIQRSQRHLLGLIARVLDYSRLEAGALTYDITDVAVVDAVTEAEALVTPQMRAKGLGYSWSGAPRGLTVRADREKLQQILLNLLSNAVKFTDARDGRPGRIEVSCAADGDDDAGSVLIKVRDTGEGIAPDKLDRVFEPFVQGDQRLTRTNQGVGLGLAISRELARGMSGELTAESVAGVGTTLTLVLPRGE